MQLALNIIQLHLIDKKLLANECLYYNQHINKAIERRKECITELRNRNLPKKEKIRMVRVSCLCNLPF